MNQNFDHYGVNTTYPNNFSSQFNLINVKSNIHHKIVKQYDAIMIEGLIIPKTVNLNNIQDFKLQIQNEIEYFCTLPFDIIKHNVKTTETNYIISIPNELLCFNSNNNVFKDKFVLPLSVLEYHDYYMVLKSTDSFDYQIITKLICYNPNLNKELTDTNYPFTINIFQYEEELIESDNIKMDRFGFLSVGVYIKLDSPLLNYKLYRNNDIVNEFTEELIEFSSSLIYKETNSDGEVEYLYYIPFNLCNNNVTDSSIKLNHNNYRINLTTKDNRYNGKIYCKNMNGLRIMCGMGGVFWRY